MRVLDCLWFVVDRDESPNSFKCNNSMRDLVIVFGVWVNNTRNMESEFGPSVGKPVFSRQNLRNNVRKT